jgi:hypothetical protein
MKTKGLFLVLFLLIASDYVMGQSFYVMRRERNLIASVGLNSSTYLGDLKDDSDIFDPKPSLSVGAMYFFHPRFAARAEFSWITLSGKDSESSERGRELRNLSFKSNNFEFAATGIANLFPHGPRYNQRPNFNAYGFAGIGVLYFNPKAELNGKNYALQPLRTEGVDYSRLAIVIPYGVGGRFYINPLFNVAIEVGWRKTFTDYIDDVSTDYLDYNSLTGVRQQLADRGPEIGRAPRPEGAIRGNPDDMDSYILYSVKVEYYLPYQIFSAFSQRKLYNQKRKSYYQRR